MAGEVFIIWIIIVFVLIIVVSILRSGIAMTFFFQ